MKHSVYRKRLVSMRLVLHFINIKLHRFYCWINRRIAIRSWIRGKIQRNGRSQRGQQTSRGNTIRSCTKKIGDLDLIAQGQCRVNFLWKLVFRSRWYKKKKRKGRKTALLLPRSSSTVFSQKTSVNILALVCFVFTKKKKKKNELPSLHNRLSL